MSGATKFGPPYTQKQIDAAVDHCSRVYFNIKLDSLDPSRRGHNGTFNGSDLDASSGNSNVTVVNDVKAFTKQGLGNLYAQFNPGQNAPLLGEAIYVPVDPSGVEDMSVPGAQLDPLGNDVGDEDPYLPESDPGFSYPHMGDISDPGGGCVRDGIPMNCSRPFGKGRLRRVADLFLPSLSRWRPRIEPGRTPSTFPGSQTTLGSIFRDVVSGSGLGDFLYPAAGATPPFVPWGTLYANPQNSDKAIASAVDRARTILSTKNPCSDYFGANAIKALNTFESILTRGYPPSGPGDTKLGIMQYGPQTTHEQPTQYRTYQYAVINKDGPFFNRFSKTRFGGYDPGRNQSQVLQILHELAHLVYSGGHELVPDDSGPTKKVESEDNTREILKHCKSEIDKIKN